MRDTSLLFSVIVPTYNRPEQLARCLDGFAAVAYPRFELIVVDDGSELPLDDVVARHRGDTQVTLLRQQNGGAAAARNAGAARARGRYLAFTDDDCAPASNWLSVLAREFAATPDCLLGGGIVNTLSDKPCAAANQLLLDFLYDYYNAVPGRTRFFATMNVAMPRRRFNELGGFDRLFSGAGGEDREFCDRWQAAGSPIRYSPHAVVFHAHSLNLRTFWRQHLNYGKGAFRFHQRYRSRHGNPVRVEPLSFYFGLLRRPFSSSPFPRSLLLLLLIFLSQNANTLGFFIARHRARAQTEAGV